MSLLTRGLRLTPAAVSGRPRQLRASCGPGPGPSHLQVRCLRLAGRAQVPGGGLQLLPVPVSTWVYLATGSCWVSHPAVHLIHRLALPHAAYAAKSPWARHVKPLFYIKINHSIKQWVLGAHGLPGTSEAVGGEPETYSCVRVPSQEKAAFRELIAQLELDPKCRGLPLSSFLILPFQRITRLKLLVQVPPLPPDRQAGLVYTSAAHLFPSGSQVSTCFLGSLFHKS